MRSLYFEGYNNIHKDYYEYYKRLLLDKLNEFSKLKHNN